MGYVEDEMGVLTSSHDERLVIEEVLEVVVLMDRGRNEELVELSRWWMGDKELVEEMKVEVISRTRRLRRVRQSLRADYAMPERAINKAEGKLSDWSIERPRRNSGTLGL